MASSGFLTTAACCAVLAATTLTMSTTTIAAAHPKPEAPPASSLSPSPLPPLPSPTTSRAADRDHHHHHHHLHHHHRTSTHTRQAGRNFTGPPVSPRHGSRSLLFHFRTSPMDALSNKHSGRCSSSGINSGNSSGSSGSGGINSSRDGRQGAVSELRCSSTAGGQAGGSFVLEQVKNIRDLGSVGGSGIAWGRVFRTGHLSDATKADATALRDVTGLRTLVDLRSAPELERDELIHGHMYEGFVNVRDVNRGTGTWEGGGSWGEGAVEGEHSSGVAGGGGEGGNESRKRRYFVSLIDESVYRKGLFRRLRKRHKAAVLALTPAAMVSRRFTQKARDIFIREINAGGLVLLNELLLQYSGDGLNRVLRLLASKEHHPVALYCTAGKDRTGLVMALTLAVLGVPDEAIVDDYALSAAAYKELDDRNAMVGALAQEDLDPDIFLGAPRHVMEDVLLFIRAKYGSVDEYLDSIGFDADWRERLRGALLS